MTTELECFNLLEESDRAKEVASVYARDGCPASITLVVNNYGNDVNIVMNGNGRGSTIKVAPSERKETEVDDDMSELPGEKPPQKRDRFSPDAVDVNCKDDIEIASLEYVIGCLNDLTTNLHEDLFNAKEEKAELEGKVDRLEKERQELQRELSYWRRWAHVA